MTELHTHFITVDLHVQDSSVVGGGVWIRDRGHFVCIRDGEELRELLAALQRYYDLGSVKPVDLDEATF